MRSLKRMQQGSVKVLCQPPIVDKFGCVSRLRQWVGMVLFVCGAAYAALALFSAIHVHGDVAVVRSWIEFGIGIAIAGCGAVLAVVARRGVRKSSDRTNV